MTLEISNVGAKDLIINSVQRLLGSSAFTVLSTHSTPLAISPGNQVDFTVRYIPTTSGTQEMAVIRIRSNDSMAPFVDVAATGNA